MTVPNSGTIVPNPGSDAARKLGCCCAILDNGYGKGSGYTNPDGSPAFWITEGCPVHSPSPEQKPAQHPSGKRRTPRRARK